MSVLQDIYPDSIYIIKMLHKTMKLILEIGLNYLTALIPLSKSVIFSYNNKALIYVLYHNE